MTIIPIKCPSCGADIEVNREFEKCQCNYCGTSFFIKEAEEFSNVSISGTVQVKSTDFIIRAGVLTEYHGESTEVVIPSNVTVINKDAFKALPITKVTIPDSVTSIGMSAFRSCSSLKSVTIGNSVTSIGQEAFENCSSLKSILIPDSVKDIGQFAFQGCSSLKSVTIGNSVTCIKIATFRDCTSLESITIPASVTRIEDGGVDNFNHTYKGCFTSCKSLKTVVLSEGLTKIGESAFWACTSLTQVNIPSTVKEIGKAAFGCCESLPIIDTHDAKTATDAFYGCYTMARKWKEQGLCTLCGGSFKGLFTKTCSKCGNGIKYYYSIPEESEKQ